jgi:hypothetical protein
MKIFAVLYSAYEIDDICYNSPYPIYLTFNYKDAIKFLNKEIAWYLSNEKVEPDEDNDNLNFQCWIGNWCYRYRLISYKLNTDLRYDNRN